MITLYKKDSKSKLRILNIYTEGADLVQESGLEGGKLVEARKTCKGKNIGKSNETSPEDQAIFEMNSKITEKLKTDYFETSEAAMMSEVLLPMLAKDYKKEFKKVDWLRPVYVQPKLDGMRCLVMVYAGIVTLISRENTNIIEEHGGSVIHLIDDLSKLPPGVYDGELYAHGHTFQENMEMIKKYRKGRSELIKVHAYDFVSEESFTDRSDYLWKVTRECPAVKLVATRVITSEKELKASHSEYLGQGYEGTIIRHGDEGYQVNKRSSSLLKYKDFIDIAVPIVDVIPMDARPLQARLVCKNDVGEFKANLKFSHAVREEILANKDKYIGMTAEIRFFEYTDSGLPRFPVCVGFRLDK